VYYDRDSTFHMFSNQYDLHLYQLGACKRHRGLLEFKMQHHRAIEYFLPRSVYSKTFVSNLWQRLQSTQKRPVARLSWIAHESGLMRESLAAHWLFLLSSYACALDLEVLVVASDLMI
jgi:hypothetical protein